MCRVRPGWTSRPADGGRRRSRSRRGQALRNCSAIVEAGGGTLDDVVQVTVLLRESGGLRRDERGVRQGVRDGSAGASDGQARRRAAERAGVDHDDSAPRRLNPAFSDELAVAGDDAAFAYDQGSWRMVHHGCRHRVGSDDDHVGGSAHGEAGAGVVEHAFGWPRAAIDDGASSARCEVDASLRSARRSGLR